MAHPTLAPFGIVFLLPAALFHNSFGGGIAVYWGQNQDEGSLASACDSGNYAIVIIGFLATFGNNQNPVLNLAGHCDPTNNGCTSLSGDIEHCKSQGIKVLLSIGGGAGGCYLSSADEAVRKTIMETN